MASSTHASNVLSDVNPARIADLSFSQDDCIIVDHPSSSNSSFDTPSSSSTAASSTPTSTMVDIIKTKRWSWIWKHMPSENKHHIYRDKKGRIQWKCQHCDRCYLESGGTRVIINHLRYVHQITEQSPREEKRHRVQGSIEAAMAIAASSTSYKRRRLVNPFDTAEFPSSIPVKFDPSVMELLVVRWISRCSISLHMMQCDEFRALLNYLYPDINLWLPLSNKTVSGWIFRTRDDHKERNLEVITNARSRIHLVLDLWTSPSSIAILGVVFSFIGDDNQHHTITAAMREIDGPHSGNNIAKTLLEIIRDWGIANKLGWIVMDNASNNDSMMEKLSVSKSRT